MESLNMNSQNQDMSFTSLLSQHPQHGLGYDGQTVTSPVTLDDSSPLPPYNSTDIKKSYRGVNFSTEEDLLLVSAWLNCSLDAVSGTDQKLTQFWEKIFEYFQQYKKTTTERTPKYLSLRWGVIQKAINKFCSKLAQVEGLHESGLTEHDKFEKAKIMYQSIERCNFQFEKCWQLLKDQPKWILHATKGSKGSRRCSVPINDAVNVIEEEIIELDRPLGRKAEKRKRKDQGRQTEESIQLRKKKYELLEESRDQEKEFYRLKAEKMEYEKEIQRERLRLEVEKMEFAKNESDQRIMMMDLSVMSEMQRIYFGELQKEIMARRNQT